MLVRFLIAALVGTGTYVGALLVERASSTTTVGATKIEVAHSDPWEKMKLELAVRRQLSHLRTEGGSPSLAYSKSTTAQTPVSVGRLVPDDLRADSEKTQMDDESDVRRTPRAEPNLPGLPVDLLNPNSAENAKDKVARSAPSSRVPTQGSANNPEKPHGEKSMRRKRSIISRQQDGASHAGRADSGADVRLASRRPPSRDGILSRYEPSSVRDYRDLRGYMLR